MFINLIIASVTFCIYFQFHFLTGSFVVFLSSNFFNCWEEFKVLNFCPCQPDVIRAPLNWTAALSTKNFTDKSVQTFQIKNNGSNCHPLRSMLIFETIFLVIEERNYEQHLPTSLHPSAHSNTWKYANINFLITCDQPNHCKQKGKSTKFVNRLIKQ